MSIKSTGKLETKSMSELVEIYNKHSEKKIKKFRDKETAIRRTLFVLSSTNKSSSIDFSNQRRVSEERTNEILNNLQSNKKSRRQPFEKPRKTIIKKLQKGTKREMLLCLLEGSGSTLEEVMVEIGWDRSTALEGIRLMHTFVGYGLTESEDGRIKVVK